MWAAKKIKGWCLILFKITKIPLKFRATCKLFVCLYCNFQCMFFLSFSETTIIKHGRVKKNYDCYSQVHTSSSTSKNILTIVTVTIETCVFYSVTIATVSILNPQLETNKKRIEHYVVVMGVCKGGSCPSLEYGI